MEAAGTVFSPLLSHSWLHHFECLSSLLRDPVYYGRGSQRIRSAQTLSPSRTRLPDKVTCVTRKITPTVTQSEGS